MINRRLGPWLVGLLFFLTLASAPLKALELPVPAAADGLVRVAPDLVKALLADYLLARSEVMPEARISIKSLEQIRPFVLPPGQTTCEIVPADPAIIGSRRFSLIFRVDGRVRANLALRVELQALAPVAVIASPLPRGAVLSPKDVRLLEKDITGLREYYKETAALLGKGLRRPVKAGEIIHAGMLATLPVVRRGELVTLTVRSGALLLTASGLALDNGGLGEMIRVRNNSSQKEVTGKVVAPGKVDLEM